MSREIRQLKSLTGLRFFLAFWVVLYHQIPNSDSLAVTWMPDFAPEWMSLLIRTGYVAVTVFFVLSGFVLAYNYDLSETWDASRIRKFAAARFSRIYPAYFTGLLLMAPLMLLRATKLAAAGDTAMFVLSTILNFTLLQAWIPQTTLTWNYPGWSLSNEAFFYVCFPFLGAVLWRLRSVAALTACVAGMWVVSLMPAILAMLAYPEFSIWAAADVNHVPADLDNVMKLVSYNPMLRLAEFAAGILLAKLYRLLPDGHWLFGRGQWIALPAAGACIAILSRADELPRLPTHNGLLLPLYMLLLFGFALGGGWIDRLLSVPAMVLLGNASYSMYILHAPLLNWFALFWRTFTGGPGNESATPVVLCSLIIIAVSCVFFVLLEEPAHKRLRVLLTQPRQVSVPSGN